MNELAAEGWFIKVMFDGKWRCWLSWRQGDLPHKESSGKFNTLAEAEAWLAATAADWEFE